MKKATEAAENFLKGIQKLNEDRAEGHITADEEGAQVRELADRYFPEMDADELEGTIQAFQDSYVSFHVEAAQFLADRGRPLPGNDPEEPN